MEVAEVFLRTVSVLISGDYFPGDSFLQLFPSFVNFGDPFNTITGLLGHSACTIRSCPFPLVFILNGVLYLDFYLIVLF